MVRPTFSSFLLLVVVASRSAAFMPASRKAFLSTNPVIGISPTTPDNVVRLQAKNKKDGSEASFEDSSDVTDERSARQQEISRKFATGDDLKRLRSDLDSLRENLKWAEAMEDKERTLDLSTAIRNGEKRDPEIVYAKSLQSIAETKASFDISPEDKNVVLERLQDRAQAARKFLPRFQLEGLWIGK